MRTPRGFIVLTLNAPDQRQVRYALSQISAYVPAVGKPASHVYTTGIVDHDTVIESVDTIDELILAEQESQDNYASLFLHRYNALQQQIGKSEGPF